MSEWVEQEVIFENPGPTVGSFDQPIDTEPTFTGVVTSSVAESTASMLVEIDENDDGIVDGTAIVLADGTFQYTLINPVVGDNLLKIRAIDSYSHTEDLVGDWVEYTLTQAPEMTPEVSSLTLQNFTNVEGVAVTDSPVIQGTITFDLESNAIDRWIEFDHDGDGQADGYATVDIFGEFTYEPDRLPFGETTIHARAVIQLADQTLYGHWSDSYTDANDAPAPIVVEFKHEPESMPMITGTLGVLDQATGTIAGRVTLDGYAYEGKVRVDVIVAGSAIFNGFAYADSNGRFEYELLKLVQGNHQVRITPLISDPNSTDGDYAGESRNLTVDYAPAALNGVPAVTSLGLAYETGASAGHTSDPTLVGEVNLTNYGGVAPPQLYVEISYADGSDTITEDIAVNPDGKFEWTPDGLKAGITYSFTALAKLWNSDPLVGAYESSTNTANKNVTPTLDGDETISITSLSMLSNTEESSGSTHKSGEAIFSGMIENDGRSGGHIVHFDHNQDGIVDGTAITQSNGSFIYRADGIEPHDSLVQTMTAWVTEVDYWGSSRTSAAAIRDFVLTRAPIIQEYSFNPSDPANLKIEGSVYSETNPSDLWIEFELFGSSLPGETPPADVTDYLLELLRFKPPICEC